MKRLLTASLLTFSLSFTACSDLQTPSSPEDHIDRQALAESREIVAQVQAEMDALGKALRARADRAHERLGKARAGLSQFQGSKITVPDDFATIQEAIDDAAPGTKIKVKPGVYTEQLEITTAGLELTAEGETSHLMALYSSVTRKRLSSKT